MNIWKYITVYKLFVLDQNIWNHVTYYCTNDYYKLELVTWNHVIVYKFFVLNLNTSVYGIVYKLFALLLEAVIVNDDH